jgi:N-acetylneuraminic acid mutarotase
LLSARSNLSASVVGGKIYAIGDAPGHGDPLSLTEQYDPITDSWIGKKDMPTARYCLSTSAVNEMIYAIGGSINTKIFGKAGTGVSTVEEYDPETDSLAQSGRHANPKSVFDNLYMQWKNLCLWWTNKR